MNLVAFMSLPKPSATVIYVDLVSTETHSLESEITDHPVEKGANVSDHQRAKADSLQLECLVSNTKLSTDGGGSSKTSQDVYDAIQKSRKDGTLWNIVTSLGTYENMAIESVSIPRTAKDSDALRFSVKAKVIRQVTGQQATIKNAGKQKDTRAGAKKDDGKKVAAEKNPDSKLFSGIDSVTDGKLSGMMSR